MSVRRIAIAGPSLHPYYIRTVGALCEAFEELGVRAVPIMHWLDGSHMETFLRFWISSEMVHFLSSMHPVICQAISIFSHELPLIIKYTWVVMPATIDDS